MTVRTAIRTKAALSLCSCARAIATARRRGAARRRAAQTTLRRRRARRACSARAPPPTAAATTPTALDKFTAAYKIFPSPKLWFNIGQANRDLGRPVEAVEAFDRFLRDAGDAPPETLAEARRSAAELKTKLGQIQVTCATDGAEITVDGKQVGSTPLGEMIWTTPGRHQVAAQHAGFSPAIEDVVVVAGKVVAVNLELRPIDLRAREPGARMRALVGDGGGAPGRAQAALSPDLVLGGDRRRRRRGRRRRDHRRERRRRRRSSGVPDTTLGAQRAF